MELKDFKSDQSVKNQVRYHVAFTWPYKTCLVENGYLSHCETHKDRYFDKIKDIGAIHIGYHNCRVPRLIHTYLSLNDWRQRLLIKKHKSRARCNFK